MTWGALQPATRDWTAACLEEAWITITSEEEAAKIDMAALVADIEALDGTVPAPTPVSRLPARAAADPVNPQTLLEELAAHVRSVAASAQQDVTELLAFLASHGL